MNPPSDLKNVAWVLRIGIAGEFVGHGTLALLGNPQWNGWIVQLLHVTPAAAGSLLTLIGIMDLAVALCVLVRPIRAVLLWAVIWGFWTALVRPVVGQQIWDFIERWANWAAPLALLLIMGWPKKAKDWLA